MSVTNEPPPSREQTRTNDYQVIHNVGEFTRSAAHHAGSVFNTLLMVVVVLASLALFWVVATMLGII